MTTKLTAAPQNIAKAVITKAGDIFLVSEKTGAVPAGNKDGFGLYYHDCRFLNGYELRLSGTEPNALVSSAHRGSTAQFELTNLRIESSDHNSIQEQTFGISLKRILDPDELAVHDVFTLQNYDVTEHKLGFCLQFHADFEDIFQIRGLHPKKVGKAKHPEWRDRRLVLSYGGADGITRTLEVHTDPEPDEKGKRSAEFQLTLQAGEKRNIRVVLYVRESRQNSPTAKAGARSFERAENVIDSRTQNWLGNYAEVHSDHELLNQVLDRGLRDLGILHSVLEGQRFFCAGLPWYGTLFGRDSIVAALQTLAFEPQIAAQTVRLLAKYQGTKTDDWRDEEPGKILHEFRRGELAHLNEIPQTPYYGAVDSTPLFLILIGEHARWTGDLSLFQEVQKNVESALHWIDHYGTSVCNRYLSYAKKSKKGLGNQGWKDSGDSIMNADGSLATQPIALVEVQGYVYRAKLLIADLYARSGDADRASKLREEAAELKTHFNRDFWLEEKQFYAIALQRDGRPAAVISSNPGQALWSGIIDEARAKAVVQHLMASDMFCGWGIRTLSSRERRFNPIGYHLGTVWPHDNSVIAAGFRNYGFDDPAIRVFDGLVKAAADFEHFRLPEVFAGFTQQEFPVPVRYPVACHPQAWAAGSVPFILVNLLGLKAEALSGCLRVVRPVLPNGIDLMEVRRIKTGGSTIDLRFERAADGSIQVEVVNKTGRIDVEVQTGDDRKAA